MPAASVAAPAPRQILGVSGPSAGIRSNASVAAGAAPAEDVDGRSAALPSNCSN